MKAVGSLSAATVFGVDMCQASAAQDFGVIYVLSVTCKNEVARIESQIHQRSTYRRKIFLTLHQTSCSCSDKRVSNKKRLLAHCSHVQGGQFFAPVQRGTKNGWVSFDCETSPSPRLRLVHLTRCRFYLSFHFQHHKEFHPQTPIRCSVDLATMSLSEVLSFFPSSLVLRGDGRSLASRNQRRQEDSATALSRIFRLEAHHFSCDGGRETYVCWSLPRRKGTGKLADDFHTSTHSNTDNKVQSWEMAATYLVFRLIFLTSASTFRTTS